MILYIMYRRIMQDDEGVLQGREGGQYSTRQIKAVEQSRAGQGEDRQDRANRWSSSARSIEVLVSAQQHI